MYSIQGWVASDACQWHSFPRLALLPELTAASLLQSLFW